MSRVWVQSVAPNNLHGFRVNQLALTDLTEGLNVVFASNASGKSTLAKAIVNLFQPELLDPEATINGVVWTGEAFISLARRRREAKFAGFPGKTKDYYLDLQSLLAGLGEDAHVQELLAKGFKFSEAAKQTPVDRGKDVKETRQLLQDLKEARRRKQALLGEEQKLPEIARLVAEAEEAHSNAEALEVALQQIELHRQRSDVDAKLRELLARFPGVDLQTSASQGELEQSLKNLRRLQAEKGRLEEELRRIGVEFAPDRDLAEADRVRLGTLIEGLKATRTLRDRSESDLVATSGSLVQERDRIFRLAPDQDPNEVPSVTDAQFQSLLQVADLADESRERKARAEGFRAALGEWGDGVEIRTEELERAQRRIIEWLEFEPEAASRSIVPAVAAGLAVIGLSLCIGSLPVRLILGLLGVGVAFVVYQKTPAPVTERLGLTGLPTDLQPTEPTREAAVAVLSKIANAKSDHEVARRLQLLAQAAEPDQAAWQSELAKLELKVDDPYRLRLVVEATSHYLEGCRELAVHEQRLEECSEREASLTEEVADLYALYRFPVLAGRELESRDVFFSWFEVSAELEAKGKELEEELETLHGFLDRQGVPVSTALTERVQAFGARTSEADRVRKLQTSLADIDSKLAARTFNLDRLSKALGREVVDLQSLKDDEVEGEIDRQRGLASDLEARRRRYQDLALEIRKAEETGTIEEHERAYRIGLNRVESRWENSCRDAVKYRISEVIRERLMTEDLPPVLETANDHLHRFSVGRYRLEFAKSPDDALGVISVNDVLDGKTQPYAKLSTGTRVHVLLALRFALVEEQEKLTSGGQMKFPILVDEAMAVSDPESSRAVADALIHVSKSRQVIVFTSQDRDVSLLKSLDPELTIHSLGAPLEVPEHVDSGLERTLLAPLSHRFDPRFPVGAHSAASVFGPGAPGGGQRLDQIKLDSRTAATMSGLERVRGELVHRYPRLSWAECSDQRWAQTAFAPRLQEFLDECVGCPHRFYEALEENRGQAFNRNQVEAAREWLEEEGYLVDPVEEEILSDLIIRSLDNEEMDTWESAIKIFGQAFIPRFDTSNWNLPTHAAVKPLNRKPRKAAPVAEGGLFDDFFAS